LPLEQGGDRFLHAKEPADNRNNSHVNDKFAGTRPKSGRCYCSRTYL
jgi:hypothetical protein